MSQRDLSKLRVEVCIVAEENPDVDPVDVKTLDGKTELEPVVDRDLDAYNKFVETKLKDRLSSFERAAIKTYLYWKTHPEIQ